MSLDLLNLYNGLLVTVSLLQTFSIGRQQGILVLLLLVLQNPAASCDDWETHQNVGCSQILPAKIRTAIRSRLQLLLQESEITLDITSQESRLDLRSHDSGNRANEEGRGVADGFDTNVSMMVRFGSVPGVAGKNTRRKYDMGVEPRDMTYYR